MDKHIFITIVAILLNILLASVIPCWFKNSNEPLINNIKKVFITDRDLILTSSLILGLIVYISLKIEYSLNIDFNNFIDIPRNNLKYNYKLRHLGQL